jgi:hypothetical protein
MTIRIDSANINACGAEGENSGKRDRVSILTLQLFEKGVRLIYREVEDPK